MQSTNTLKGGLALLAIGVIAFGSHVLEFTTSPAIQIIGAILICGGFAVMSFGLFKMFSGEFLNKQGVSANNSNIFSIGLFRCMIAISIADNNLDDNEIKEICRIYKHLTNTEMSEQVIRDTANEMVKGGISIENEINTVSGTLSKELKDKLIIASLYILAADGNMDDGELIMLDSIRLGLKLSKKHIEKIKNNFLENKNLS